MWGAIALITSVAVPIFWVSLRAIASTLRNSLVIQVTALRSLPPKDKYALEFVYKTLLYFLPWAD
ncbi:MAG: hypothetical protein Fur0046_37920 [Cyanobacteria bacterium J069]|nr:MAG: hypothetical protein D6742_02645 [Cyanobacteria bacterium J069]